MDATLDAVKRNLDCNMTIYLDALGNNSDSKVRYFVNEKLRLVVASTLCHLRVGIIVSSEW